jgi:4-hydroxy-tetrahydrodipicolinate synthase
MNMAHQGIVVPMVTPFDDVGEVDEGALRWLTDYLIAKGMHILFPAGSTGEGWSLSRQERKRVFEIVVDEVRGRVPVFAGTGAITTRETVYLTAMAEDCGVDAAVVITPFYIVPSDDELYEHYAAVASATKLPIYPYNNPHRTGVNLSASLVSRLAQIENLAGIKDSSRDVALTMEFIRRSPDGFKVFVGPDNLMFSGLAVGCDGAVPAFANLAPDIVAKVYRDFHNGDWSSAITAQHQLSQLRATLSLGTFPAMVKEAMALAGMSMGAARAPVGGLTPDNRKQLRDVLEAVGVL